MRDAKAELGLGGDNNWPRLFFVPVNGVEGAGSEIGDWHSIAVLEVEPPDARFQVGFKNGRNAQRLRVPVDTESGRFGMRIGEGDVEFFALPLDPDAEVVLRLVVVTEEGDPLFAGLPVY